MTQLKVRARAVDMLGRQQIAGIPTAIHELFKNAHDAYAERVEVDYFRQSRVLVLRDDGYGMTQADLEDRWLTLGTESRVGANKRDPKDEWRGPKELAPRVIMGEKGIGRLAIAVIAPLTLVMTRATRHDGLQNLVVALVHWGIFEQPGIEISSIDIPIVTLPGGSLPSNLHIKELASQIAANLSNLKHKIEPNKYRDLIQDLECIRDVSPDLLDVTLNKDRDVPLTLSGNGHGTHFIALPVAVELNDDIDGGADREASKLERNLLGFSNFMRDQSPVIRTEFRDHLTYEPRSLIGPNNFFTADEFNPVDHSFDGKFDEYGQFDGTVSIFGQPRKYVCNWTPGRGRAPRCGSFDIRFAHVHGSQKESLLGADDWLHITQKLDRIGGLYIYRDGIRILPYGNSDVDWLDIEKRRTKSASDWFFSFRRIFGYISISHAANENLSEKAGREGFRENQAYRDFRSILINFFEQLALEFFRRTSPQGDDYFAKKEELRTQTELLEKQKRKAENRRAAFREEMKRFSDRYERNYFEEKAEQLLSDLNSELNPLLNIANAGEFVQQVKAAEAAAWSRYRKLDNEVAISQPKGLALGRSAEKEWSAYERMAEQIRKTIIDPLQLEISRSVHDISAGRIADLERVEFALQEIQKERDSSVKELTAVRKAALQAAERMQSAVRNALTEELSATRHHMEALIGNFTKRSVENPQALATSRGEIERQLLELHRREHSMFNSFKRQMDDLTEGIVARETLDDRFVAIEVRNQKLEEQIDFYTEFAQIGMAVGILQHEFERAANGIRIALGELKPWADRNPPIAKIYKPLRTHIEHLDGYFRAIDPLGRRLQRATVELSGDEILTAVRRVFSASLDELHIDLVPSHAFRNFVLEGKSASLVGAFINVIDNAIYWIDSRADDERKIFLDADADGFLISNTGPGIEERLRDQIFDFGTTYKSGGRGMGLAVSREALRRDGLEIELICAGSNINPVFRIRKK